MGDSISPFRRRGMQILLTQNRATKEEESLIGPLPGGGLFTKPLTMKEIQIHIPVTITIP
jgi:hypothetical protein